MGQKMMKRRVKGEGNVYRCMDGRCMGEYEDANGRKRCISGKTKAEVRTKLRKLLEDRDKGIAYDSEGLTAGRYMDRWLESMREKVRPGTYKRTVHHYCRRMVTTWTSPCEHARSHLAHRCENCCLNP
jgi:hypothetical protein